jgi:spore coat polysaccharide biosynthesis protein SpsF
MKNRKLIAAIACRNQGSRLYGKPIQNLDVGTGIRIIDNIIACLQTIECIDQIVLGISEGIENEVFKVIAEQKQIEYIVGDQIDVLDRLIQCGTKAGGSDIFRITSESPFLYFEPVQELWEEHVSSGCDATFMDNIIDGCGFEIISLQALKNSHENGNEKHRSELCTLYIRENADQFKVVKKEPPATLIRWDLRLTVDNPEDLVVCRAVYNNFKQAAPRIPITEIVKYLDENPHLIDLIEPFTESGYATMNL